jgi:dihydrolipoamide dehydrogenase
MADRADLVIIGGGPGGYAAALYGAAAGLDVAMVENQKVGGTCLHRGCIPAKALLETASVRRALAGAAAFGFTVDEPTMDFGVSQDRSQSVIDKLHSGLSSLLGSRKVRVVNGTGRLLGAGRVAVSGGEDGDLELEGDAVLLASGSVPRTIPGFDVQGDLVVTSDELLKQRELPASAVVIGGGAIGCEFASMMSDLGTEVTILEALPKILPGLDADVAKVVERSFKKRGITIHTGVDVTGHEPGGAGTTVRFGEDQSIEVEQVVVSVGRRPLSDVLGLEGTGVEVDDRGFVKVDANCRTTLEGVWAVGDLIPTAQLAHVGFAEAVVVVKDILGEDPVPVDYDRVPWCIYCHPEVAFAGLSEESAKEAGHDVVTVKHRFGGNGRALIIGDADGLVKVIAAKDEDGRAGEILGVHMVGPWVTEQLGQGYLAVNWEATVDDVAQFIQPHPSLSENFGEAVMSLTGRGLHG